MQTEDADAKEVDEISNRVIEELEPDMTVKEEVEEPQPIVCECSPSSILPEECLAPDSLEVHDRSFCESEEFVHNNLRPDCTTVHVVPCPTPHCLDVLVTSAEDQGQANPLTNFSLQDQQKGDRGRCRGRRRSRWKLKFHHQALPPEYLDHYEAAMAQQDAAAKSTTSIKPETKTRSTSSTTKALPPLVPRSVMTEKKFDNLVHLIKKEQDAGKFGTPQPSLLRNLCPPDQVQFMPVSTLSVSSENELLSRLQQNFQRYRAEDISTAAEKITVNDKRTSTSNNISQGKGLLGSLLSSNVSPEISIKACSEADRKKRSSVIMTNSTSTNLNRVTTSVAPATPTTSRVMKYQDLPYMGEITLDNTKPRRGRKPKKADICHLIYKNYGTIFPGAPNQNATAESEDVLKMKTQSATFTSTCHTNSKINKKGSPLPTGIKCRPLDSLKSSPPINHADVQNRIISSLLEKRLTAASMDAKRNALSLESSLLRQSHTESITTTNSMREPWLSNKHVTPSTDGPDEPLNLCIKDLNQLKIRLLRKHGNFYEPRSNNNVIVKSEPNSPSEAEQLELRDSPKETMSKFSDDAESTGTSSSRNQTPLSSRQLELENSLPFPPINIPTQFSNSSLLPTDAINPITSGYVYWPNAGVFVHPMALQSQLLYYQKMGAIPLLPVPSVETAPTFIPSPIAPNTLIPNLPAMMAAQRNNVAGDNHTKDHQKVTTPCIKPALPKGFSSILHTKPPEMPSELSFPRMKRLAPLGNLPHAGSTSTTKRKRSAIFIPPIPSENNNPTTEVSICKFKFTGGAKPSLQEKKMLSVDSGGNFRYYSGTGDKSMRGYEFFPRESLQTSSGLNNATLPENIFAASALASCESLSPNSQHLGHSTTFTEKTKTNFPSSDVRASHQVYVPNFSEGILDTSQNDTIMKNRETGENQLDDHVSADFNKKLSVGSEPDSYSANKAEESCSQFKTRRKRKTRKSLAREKLEQTFKEKGFLIQTQQLESAEGATYCKFRQLRKFTRYLFRSWKDYLPGNVREMSVAAGVGGSGTTSLQRDLEVEGELSSNSPHSNQETTELVQQSSAE